MSDSTDNDPMDTGEFDMETYAFVVERMMKLRLPNLLWKVTPLRNGVMLNMERGGERDRMFIQSTKAMENWIQVIVDWATGKGLS